MLKEILEFNRAFVEKKEYEKYRTAGRLPDKKTAVITCMDTRLTELLPAAMGLRNGDVQVIKTAGGTVTHEYGGVVRSLIIAIYEMGVEEVLVIGHDDCGMQGLDCEHVVDQMRSRGVSEEDLALAGRATANLNRWLSGFECVEASVRRSVEMLREHPLIPADVRIYGLIIDPETGALRQVED